MTHYEASFYDTNQELRPETFLLEADNLATALVVVARHLSERTDVAAIVSVAVEEYDEEDDPSEAA